MLYSYRSLCKILSGGGVENAADEASLLLGHVCGVSRSACLTDPTKYYETDALDQAVARRLDRYPLQYILGVWSFCGFPFKVNEHCLIPRPDTELLVELAVKVLPKGALVADLCTGSGCIAISLLRLRPDLRAVALELYPDTLALATENAARNGVGDRFTPIEADLLTNGVERLSPFVPFDAILSNPPYIPSQVVDGLEPELFFEPRAALDGGDDGLTFYRAILRDYVALLKPQGRLLLEIGYDQAEALTELTHSHTPDATVKIHRDLGGNDRVVDVCL